MPAGHMVGVRSRETALSPIQSEAVLQNEPTEGQRSSSTVPALKNADALWRVSLGYVVEFGVG